MGISTAAIGPATSHSNVSTRLTLPFSFSSRSVFFELGSSPAAHVPQAIIVFMAGEHRDAISRVDDLIATVHFNSICYVVQACAHALPTANTPTDISSRHICIFSLETLTWSIATTKVQYSHSSVHKPKCDTMRADRSW